MTADLTFPCMGSQARLIVDSQATAAICRAFLEDFEAALSRFRPDSELCRLNADPRDRVPASELLRTAVRAGLWAAERTGGLVDPALTTALEAAGYASSRRVPELRLADALRLAPPRAAASPRDDAEWRRVRVDPTTITRPPGLRLDTGGTGKGLAADLLAARLDAAARGAAAGRDAARRWAVDCGGDLRVSGGGGAPFRVDVRHPLTGEAMRELTLTRGAVATSGIDRRLWRGAGGSPAHHLLDPSTGEPAWTGLIGATALAPTALEAEALAKAALLSGPQRAAGWLTTHGGLTVRDDGDVEAFGPLRPRRTIRVRRRPRPVMA
jgi:thiamine biosynthesis lipoprotein